MQIGKGGPVWCRLSRWIRTCVDCICRWFPHVGGFGVVLLGCPAGLLIHPNPCYCSQNRQILYSVTRRFEVIGIEPSEVFT